jgi:hypothetical protein
MARRFARTTEDFVCSTCGVSVRGDGYTNHCPACLWSRHVDVFPGDRASECGAMMRPVAVELTGDGVVLTHSCQACGHRRRNRSATADDGTAIVALAAAVAAEAAAAGELPGADGGGQRLRGTGRGSGAPRRPGRRR